MPYHHYIPRFILRRFIPTEPGTPGPSIPKTRKERLREARKARKKGQPDPESISVFDLQSRSIKSVPIATTFGVLDFYQDGRNQEDVEHLENKLAKLEDQAARVIRELHVAADRQSSNSTFTLPRIDLQLLRKFIFLLHYRSCVTEKTYFQEDHPRNAPVRQWIRHLKRTKGYTTDKEIWLDGLRYYLYTEHHDILNHAKQFPGHGPFRPIGETDANTPSHQWHALAYESFANNYYLGIWRSHDDSEFVLGNNSHGVWEGTLAGSAQLFKIYALSPKITVALKSNMSKTLPPQFEDSTLSDLPLGLPETTYNRAPPSLESRHASPRDRADALQRHLQSPNSNNDQFTFRINKLTINQTYLINQVVLENLNPDGLLVFSSKEAMLPTAQRYDTAEGPFLKKNRQVIADLVRCLQSTASGSLSGSDSQPGTNASGLWTTSSSSLPSTPSPPTSMPTPDPISGRRRVGLEDLMLPREIVSHVLDRYGPGRRFSASDWGSQDVLFDILLSNILDGSDRFKNDYDRARYIHRKFPPLASTVHPLVHFIAKRMQQAKKLIEVIQEMAADGIRDGVDQKLPSGTAMKLVDSLGEDDARHLLEMLFLHCESLGLGWLEEQWEGKRTLSQKLLEQVTMMAYLELLLEVDPNLAASLCNSVTFIEVVTSPPNPNQTHASAGEVEEVHPIGYRETPKAEARLRPRSPQPGPGTNVSFSASSSPSTPNCTRSPISRGVLSDLMLAKGVNAVPVGASFSEADCAFDDMLLDVLEGSIKFETEYERALYIHRLFPPLPNSRHPFVCSVTERMSEIEGIVGRIWAAQQAQGRIVKRSFSPGTPTKLVDSLSPEDTNRLFKTLFLHFESIGFGWKEEKSDREFACALSHTIFEQVTVIAYLKALLQVDPNLTASMCSSVVFVGVIPQPDSSWSNDGRKGGEAEGNRPLIDRNGVAEGEMTRFKGLPQNAMLPLISCVFTLIFLLGLAVSLVLVVFLPVAIVCLPFYVLKCLWDWAMRGIMGESSDPPQDNQGVSLLTLLFVFYIFANLPRA